MKKIVAIGGGEIGRPGHLIETAPIDKEIIRLTGKRNPRLLFIPTASNDSESYFEVVKKYFGRTLGCKTDALWLIKDDLSKAQIEKKIMSSDIVYVGGGNTLKMLQVWKRTGTDKILKKAYNKGIVLSGLSAGSLCWFLGGMSDSQKMIDAKAELIKIRGLGLIKAMHSPHHDVEKDRRPALKKMMKNLSGVALAIDNCCAIEFVDQTYRVISSKPRAKAYKAYWKGGKYYEEPIQKEAVFKPLADLLKK